MRALGTLRSGLEARMAQELAVQQQQHAAKLEVSSCTCSPASCKAVRLPLAGLNTAPFMVIKVCQHACMHTSLTERDTFRHACAVPDG
jgi:hypothetical protein